MADPFVAVRRELARAKRNHGPMRSAHEGYAIILEELDELWDEVKKKRPNRISMREEAVQVAAMAIRFIEEVCGVPVTRGLITPAAPPESSGVQAPQAAGEIPPSPPAAAGSSTAP